MSRPRRPRAQQNDISEYQWAFLNDAAAGVTPERKWDAYELKSNKTLGLCEPITEWLWRDHGADVVARWAVDHPGTRPSLWWAFSAPRAPFGSLPHMFPDASFPQPRLRLGGTGRPAYEVLAYTPSFAFGLPVMWVGVSDEDPPLFESQAAYLDRNGLLLPGERRRLSPADFCPAPITPGDTDATHDA